MKTLAIILLLFVSSISFGQTVANPDVKLLDAAIAKYLNELETKFKDRPSEFIIEAEDKSVFKNIKMKVGSTTILVKSPKELRDYSTQRAGKIVHFFSISVEKEDGKYLVDILADNIKCTMQNGSATFSEGLAEGRSCLLMFNASFAFESIDCLLLSSDPGN